jgi:formate hydrogenlyase transcriptional activator
MPRQRSGSVLKSDPTGLSTESIEEFLRFTRRLNPHTEPEQLLRALSEELHDLVRSSSVAFFYRNGDTASSYGLDRLGNAIELEPWVSRSKEEFVSLSGEQWPIVISSLDEEARFLATSTFFLEHGNQTLCILPLCTSLRAFGLLFVARRLAFTEAEICFLSLVADHISLAIDDRLNFAHSKAIQAQLEDERTKLRLVLDLNNSVVSNLELRDLLRSISPNIRKVLRLDGVALMLPAADGAHLQLYALDFPDNKEFNHHDMSSSLDESLPGQVFRSGKPWIGDLNESRRSGFDNRVVFGESVKTLCMLPLLRCERVLGVLCLMRLEKNAFAPHDVELLSQIAGQVAIAIDNALAYRQITELTDELTQEKLYLEDELRTEMNFEEIIGNSNALRRVLRQVEAVAPTTSTVLIHGETGTGKELIARAVHNLSQRHAQAFLKLNCAAIPTGLLESELFGHEKGAFTGAITQHIGRFELASRGTIFLDEVGEIPLELQPKLLRVLQEREFERLGSSRTCRTDARLIAATNRNLAEMVEEQKFRSDLFYRLNVFPIQVPPLRDRIEDIPFLVRHFAQHFARNMSKQIDTISSETMNSLVRYPWPGNIRELQNVIERAVILSQGPTLKVPLTDLKPRATDSGSFRNSLTTLEDVERRHILSVLEQTNWVFSGPNGAAARLGIKRPTLQFRLHKLGITRPRSS